MSAAHPDDFTLLVLLEGEMSELEAARLKRHLAECAACAAAYREIEKLDRTLKKTLPDLEAALSEPELPEGDVYRCRPDRDRPGRPRSCITRVAQHRHYEWCGGRLASYHSRVIGL